MTRPCRRLDGSWAGWAYVLASSEGGRVVYLGVDLHRRRSHAVAVDDEGRELLSLRLDNSEQRSSRCWSGWAVGRGWWWTSYGWEWLVELLDREGC